MAIGGGGHLPLNPPAELVLGRAQSFLGLGSRATPETGQQQGKLHSPYAMGEPWVMRIPTTIQAAKSFPKNYHSEL